VLNRIEHNIKKLHQKNLFVSLRWGKNKFFDFQSNQRS